MLDMCAKVAKMSPTFEQQYGHILDEFVTYCNNKNEIMRAEYLDELKRDFIKMKMERWK